VDFKRETRYLVFKHTDIANYLSGDDMLQLAAIAKKITDGRTSSRKDPLDCVVVESKWHPAYDQTWEAVQRQWEIVCQS
jgi:hypothetical protein